MMAKRITDIVFAGLLMPLLSCILPVVWVCGRLEGFSSLLYRQNRIGSRGSNLRLLKFRTLGPGRGYSLTRTFFRFCRKLGFDELPQVVQVLRGEMSVVGPRPLLREELYQHHQRTDPSLQHAIDLRQSTKPGMTGLPQVSMPVRTRSGAEYWDMLDQDAWYAANRTIWLDLLILAFTPLYLFSSGRILLPTWIVPRKARLSSELWSSKLTQNAVRQ